MIKLGLKLCQKKPIHCLNKHAKLLQVIVTLLATILGVYEFKKHVEQQRVQYFIDFGRKYTEDEDIGKVVEYLEYLKDLDKTGRKQTGNKIEKPSAHQVEMYMRFFEELELMIRSEAVTESAAIYLFGYYTTVIEKHWKSDWPTLKYDEACWSVYRDFTKRVKNFNYNCKNIEL